MQIGLQNDFRVTGGLEHSAFLLQLMAQFRTVINLTIVNNGGSDAVPGSLHGLFALCDINDCQTAVHQAACV